MMSDENDMLTKEQAKEMLAVSKNGMVHTFLDAPFGLIGADHSLKSLYKDIDKAYMCKRTGELAQSMGHGLVIIPKKKCKQSELLFVETKRNDAE